jgi:exoribonuclease-2
VAITELVAEMMISANQVAGLYAAQHGLFVPYRHQAAPHEVDAELLREFDGKPLTAVAESCVLTLRPTLCTGLPEHIKYAELVRHMQAAELSLVPTRHTSLGTLVEIFYFQSCSPYSSLTANHTPGLDTYVQVTSPIRRFADMIAHRQIVAHLGGSALPYSAETLAVDYLPHIRQRFISSQAPYV